MKTTRRHDIRHQESVTLLSAYQRGVAMLKDAEVVNARREAFWLLEAALGRSRLAVYVDPQSRVTSEDWERTESAFRRRASREPLQYIVGTQTFLNRDFLVRPGVFIPRPETELIVEAVATATGVDEGGPVVDMGTGSGCLAVSLALARPVSTVYATDCSLSALRLAGDNARRHGVDHRIRFVHGDGLAPLSGHGIQGTVSVIVSNPPYIPSGELERLPPDVRMFEPLLALDGGPNGLAFYDRLLTESPVWLRPGGLLVMEMGANQSGDICRMVSGCAIHGVPAWSVKHIRRDQAGIERVLCLERTEQVWSV